MDDHFIDLKMEQSATKTHSPWLVSLADLLALMLAFFVLLFSMTEVKVAAWKEVLETLGQKYDPTQIEVSDSPQAMKNMTQVKEIKAVDLAYLENIYHEKIASNEIFADVKVSRVGAKLVLSLPADNFFQPGSDKKVGSSSEALQLLANSLAHIRNRVEIYGHTDPEPISSQNVMFRSNWELSLARAIVIANEISVMGYQGSIRAYGFGSSRFDEISDQITLGRKYTHARRVDIIIRQSTDEGWK